MSWFVLNALFSLDAQQHKMKSGWAVLNPWRYMIQPSMKMS